MIKLFVVDLGNVILPFDHRQIPARLLEKSREKERFFHSRGLSIYV